MKISKYNNFLINENFRLILEANLELLPNLELILKSMESPIAKFILGLSGKDLKSDINLLGRDLKEPGYITYFPQKKLDESNDLYMVIDNDMIYDNWSEGEKFFSVASQHVDNGAIGKVIKVEEYYIINNVNDPLSRILSGNNPVAHFITSDGKDCIISMSGLKKIKQNPKYEQSGKSGRVVTKILNLVEQNFTTQDIEKFSNEFKSKTSVSDFEMVKGESIKYWYLGDRYIQKGTLANSCMRYDKCQSYFGIYVNNPKVCQLLILHNKEDRDLIDGRALVWTLTDGRIFMDRIYYTSDHIKDMFIDWAKKEGWLYKAEQNSSDSEDIIDGKEEDGYYSDTLIVELDHSKHNYSKFPYMDTLKYWDSDDKICNDSSASDYGMEDTDGGDGGCSECDGSGRVECAECENSGRVECEECGGNRELSCGECDGEGRVDCNECNDGEVECNECDGSGEIEGEECSDCKGKGLIECPDCHGKSSFECPECEGRKTEDCSRCDGEGDHECYECDGSGYVNCSECG